MASPRIRRPRPLVRSLRHACAFCRPAIDSKKTLTQVYKEQKHPAVGAERTLKAILMSADALAEHDDQSAHSTVQQPHATSQRHQHQQSYAIVKCASFSLCRSRVVCVLSYVWCQGQAGRVL